MSSRVVAIAPIALVVAGLLVLFGLALSRQASATNESQVGSQSLNRPAPDVELAGFDGQAVRLLDLRGQVVVLNFWASWCEPCREETAALESVWRRYRQLGVVIVGLNTWDGERPAREFVERAGVTYWNGTDVREDAAVEYRVTGIPETFLIDGEGQIVKRWRGPVREADLSAALDEVVTRE